MNILLAMALAASTNFGIHITITANPNDEMGICRNTNTIEICECSVPMTVNYINLYGDKDLKVIREQAQTVCEQKAKGIDNIIIVY